VKFKSTTQLIQAQIAKTTIRAPFLKNWFKKYFSRNVCNTYYDNSKLVSSSQVKISFLPENMLRTKITLRPFTIPNNPQSFNRTYAIDEAAHEKRKRHRQLSLYTELVKHPN
jgi:membrane fusion protein (multidrug efflux system)